MSGIYIHGMDMPKSCHECGFEQEGFWCGALLQYEDVGKCDKKRHEHCPLVPVPDHGRLIDADALDDILADQSEDAYNRTHAPRSWEKALSVMRDYLEGAPTIIPADTAEEGEG